MLPALLNVKLFAKTPLVFSPTMVLPDLSKVVPFDMSLAAGAARPLTKVVVFGPLAF